MIRTVCIALAFLFALAAPVIAGPFEDGKAAAESGNYATAMKIWKPLAEGGHARAQAAIGLMYSRGAGVPADRVTAHMWFSLAEMNGDKSAEGLKNVMEVFLKPDQIDESKRMAREWMAEHQ